MAGAKKIVFASVVVGGAALIAASWLFRGGKEIAGQDREPSRENVQQPEPPRTFEEVYGLAGRTVKRVAPPFGPERMAFFSERGDVGKLPNGPDAMLVRWREGKPELWTYQWSSGGMPEADRGFIMQDLIEHFTGFTPMDVDSDRRLMTMLISGDIVLDGAATEEEKLVALEQLAWEAKKQRVALKVVETEQDVIVLKGQWKYTPVAGHAVQDVAPSVEVYGADLNKDGKSVDTGEAPLEGWNAVLSYHLGRPVEVVATGGPVKAHLRLNYNGDGSPESKAKARDVDLVVQHLCEQTGLTRAVEKRMRRRLVMSATTEQQLP